MDVNFSYKNPEPVEPIYFEKIWGEKPGGGLVPNPSFDLPKSLAVGRDADGKLAPIKAYRLVKDVAIIDTTIEIEKGSGVVVGDKIAHGDVAVACTAVDTTTNDDKDVVTVTLGVVIPKGTVLFQSSVESVEAVEEVAYGYYDAIATTEDALKVVAEEATPGDNEIKASAAVPYKGIKNLAVDMYVVLKDSVAGVAGVKPAPIYTPEYLLGSVVYAGKGDQLAKLVNGANVRKETVNASTEVLALLNGIKAV